MSVPYDITDAPEEINKEMRSSFPGYDGKYVHVGPKKYLLTEKFKDIATEIYNMPLREDDVWLVSYPRTGSTWTHEMAWLINNDLDYERATNEGFFMRVPHIDGRLLMSDTFVHQLLNVNNWGPEVAGIFLNAFTPSVESIQKMKSPRQIKTHLAFSLLPPKLLDTCKVIYVARNPKDVAVSNYYLTRLLKYLDFKGSFEQYWDLFHGERALYGPYLEHVLEAWRLRNHPNLLFLFYEDMKKDLPGSLHKIARFLKKTISDDQIPKLVEYLKIDSFKKNPTFLKEIGEVKGYSNSDVLEFFRQGKSGSWRSEFSAELNAKADEWIREYEKQTDLRFQF